MALRILYRADPNESLTALVCRLADGTYWDAKANAFAPTPPAQLPAIPAAGPGLPLGRLYYLALATTPPGQWPDGNYAYVVCTADGVPIAGPFAATLANGDDAPAKFPTRSTTTWAP